ncbi:MAG: sel1 repeat family protein [Nitrospirota bacterium]|nr:sel1 repeat family protein [Nitrospirota bacterium]
MKTFMFLKIVFFVMVVGATPVWSNFLDGEDAYLREDYARALEEWQPLAKAGDAEAQNMLGYMYRYGQGIPQDFEQARQWYRLAADQGHARAQNNLGAMYRQGLGVPQNFEEALRWFRRSAEQGNGGAQSHLGLMYFEGEGIAKDVIQAYKWAYLSAQQGVEQAIFALEFLEKELRPEQIEEAKRLAREWTPKGEEVAL